MSAFLTLRTPMLDRECLIEAIEATGLRRADIEVHARARALTGYQSGMQAEIVLRKQVTGDRYNDVGFQRTPTGYVAILSDDHPRFGRAWLADVQVAYDAAWTRKQARLAEAERQRLEEERRQLVEAQRVAIHAKAKAMGYRVKETRVGETVRLALVRRTY